MRVRASVRGATEGGGAGRGGAAAVPPVNPHRYKCRGQNCHDNCRAGTKHPESHCEPSEALGKVGVSAAPPPPRPPASPRAHQLPQSRPCARQHISLRKGQVRLDWTAGKRLNVNARQAERCPGSRISDISSGILSKKKKEKKKAAAGISRLGGIWVMRASC